MSETLLYTYAPLVFWTGLGALSFRFVPEVVPRWIGRGLYWVGIPVEIFSLAHQTNFAAQVGLAPLITALALLGGAVLAAGGLRFVQNTERSRPDHPGIEPDPSPSNLPPVIQALESADPIWDDRPRQGSFMISSILGNTGFVGLAITPAIIQEPYLSWVVFYSVAHNVMGTYGIGVFLASYFGRSEQKRVGWTQVRDVVTVPSLWGFCLGCLTHGYRFPDLIEVSLHRSIWVVIPVALLLMGMRLSQLQGWRSLKLAIVPTLLKVLIIPAIVGLGTTLAGFAPEASLAMVIMSGMPTAFAGLILAEEYELDRELIASSILVSTVALMVTIPCWLIVFRGTVG